MREILFRGKTKENGEWVQGYFVYAKSDFDSEEYREADIIPHYTDRVYKGEYNVVFPCIPETVGQYTGLTDKNGKRIFEGDICRNTKTGEIVSVKWHGTMAGYVWSKRKEKSYLFDFGELFRAYDKYEIIGNIHDNPELLKGGAE